MKQAGRPTAKAAGFRDVPRCRRGSSRRNPLCGFLFGEQRKCTESVSPPSNSPDRPSPKRLPGGRAFNLGRSVLGALGNLLADLADVKHLFETMCRKLRQSRSPQHSLEKFGPRKSTPRRWLPRPTSQPTAAEATVCRRAINLRRSVLGAHGTLRPRDRGVKCVPIAKPALCVVFLSHSMSLRLSACALKRKGPWFRRAGCAFVHLPG